MTLNHEKFIFYKPPYLLKKIFKNTTETYILLQKSSRKSYEHIHHNLIFYVSYRLDFWKLCVDSEQSKNHCLWGSVPLEEIFLKNNRNLHFATKILKKIVWTHTPQLDFVRFVQNRFLKIIHWLWKMKNSLLWTCMFLLNKFFKKITETYILLQKSSRKSYEHIHHNLISYVSCKTDFWKLHIDSEKWKFHIL